MVRIGLVFHLLGEGALRRLGRHFDDVAIDVDLPAVIEAAETAIFVTAVHERRAAVRAIFVENADLAVSVAEDHQILAKQTHLDRIAIRLRHFLDQAGGHPVPAENLSHRGVALDAAHQIVLVPGEHVVLPLASVKCLGL